MSLAPLGPIPPLASAMEKDEDAPLAGYTNGAAYIRSRDSNFVLFPSGRLNVDAFVFPNRGAPADNITPDGGLDQRPRDTIFVRRARIELMGTLFKRFDFMLGGEYATIPILFQSATLTDVFVNANFTPWANIQFGQFDAPFTLENRTSDKYIDFMERSLTVRGLGAPSNKELGLMVHGLAPRRFLRYEIGVFNGDGQNVRNPDSHFDFIGRAYFAPLAFLQKAQTTRWLGEIWLGGSFWYGQRIEVPYPVFPITTQGSVTILTPPYGDGRLQTPNGDLLKWALEVNVPIGPFGMRFEMVRSEREGVGIFDSGEVGKRVQLGQLNRTGSAYYIQAWYWILGSPNMLPTAGQEIPTRWIGYRKGKESFPIGLYVTARYERLNLRQDEVPGQGTGLSEADRGVVGNLSVDSFAAAVNLWMTRHLRFSVNYVLNYLDGDMPFVRGDSKINVGGPLMQFTNTYYRTAQHEILFRAAIGL